MFRKWHSLRVGFPKRDKHMYVQSELINGTFIGDVLLFFSKRSRLELRVTKIKKKTGFPTKSVCIEGFEFSYSSLLVVNTESPYTSSTSLPVSFTRLRRQTTVYELYKYGTRVVQWALRPRTKGLFKDKRNETSKVNVIATHSTNNSSYHTDFPMI